MQSEKTEIRVEVADVEYSLDCFHCHDCEHSWNAIDESERPRDECPNCGSDDTDVPTEGNTQPISHARPFAHKRYSTR